MPAAVTTTAYSSRAVRFNFRSANLLRKRRQLLERTCLCPDKLQVHGWKLCLLVSADETRVKTDDI